jgi:uncharacterized protein YndB with AHSA1/START domain
MKDYVLSVERTIKATPEAIFAVLSDASKHSLIDGSGMLQGSVEKDPEPLALGATFGMQMKLVMRYSTVNRVVEFEPDRRIAWQTGPDGTWGKVLAGRIWRYTLDPVDGGTKVVENWDITPDHQRFLLKLGGIYWGKTRRDMERTLARLDELVTA